MPKQIFEAWEADDGCTLTTPENVEFLRAKDLLGTNARLLYRLEADTFEEALAIHNLRMGWGPYQPMGDPEPCPKCGAWFYPQGSGTCWRCGEPPGPAVTAGEDVSPDLRRRILLSVQRALVGEVTREMRAVEVDLSARRILIRVFTDGDSSEALRAAFDAGMVAQVVADFPYPERGDPEISLEFVRCDSPRPVPVRGTLVFALAGVSFTTDRAAS